MAIVDIHIHYIPGCYLRAIRAQPNSYDECVATVDGIPTVITSSGMQYTIVRSLCQISAVIDEMDKAGIDVGVVSAPPPLFHYELSPSDSRQHARLLNDALAEEIRGAAGRLLGMAYVPLQHPEVAAEELERAVLSLGMRSVQICSHVFDKNLDDEGLAPFFAKAEELAVLILIHPWDVAGRERMRRHHLANLVGNAAETALAVGSLIFGGVLDRFPKLRICLSHGGGAAPFLMGRFDRGYHVRAECKGTIHENPSSYLPRFYFDTITFSLETLQFLLDAVGWRHLLLGSDFPFHLLDVGEPNPLDLVCKLRGISDEQVAGILGENAEELLGLAGR